MMEDPLYWSEKDPDFRAHALSQFDAVYGTGPVSRDATGRMQQPRARPEYRAGLARIAPFAPKPRPEDARTVAPVGRTAKPRRQGEPVNRRADVLGLQRALAGLGHYAWTASERSGQVTPALDTALRRFQQANALTVDGYANPDGETLRFPYPLGIQSDTSTKIQMVKATPSSRRRGNWPI